ncbi:unnamed protein product [Moneuplotes crassus]|uniref:Uncharacterized protein n=1 Tax=Euplotes crassus TaxID=5936 RepID=A0AAD1U4P5_EUPCR|nr:unnamed protein product [Moneuplotes crassus]
MENLNYKGEYSSSKAYASPLSSTPIQNKAGVNFINTSDASNFLHEIIGLKSAYGSQMSNNNPHSLTPSKNKGNSSVSNIKFGKLTIQRGTSKESLDSAVAMSTDRKKTVAKLLNFTRTPDQTTKSSKGKGSKIFSKFMTPRIKNFGGIQSKHRLTSASRVGSRKDLLPKPLFQKLGKSRHQRKNTKSPKKQTASSKSKKRLHALPKKKRAITPVIQKKNVLTSNRYNKTRNHAENHPFLFSNQDTYTGLSIQKCNESDELESIEQDIADLDKLKNIGKIGDQFVFELDESEKRQRVPQFGYKEYDGFKNAFKNQPKQAKSYQKTLSSYEQKVPFDQEIVSIEEAEKKKKIMEYLKIVKDKISRMETKLTTSKKENNFYKQKNAELEAQLNYYRTKSLEFENSREKSIEKERVMAMKYGIILSQNKELLDKCRQLKAENEDLKMQLHDRRKKESLSDAMSNGLSSKVLNKSTQDYKRDYSSPIMDNNNPNRHSSTTLSQNFNDFEKSIKLIAKNLDKSNDFEAAKSLKEDRPGMKPLVSSKEVNSDAQDQMALQKLLHIQKFSLSSLPENQQAIINSMIQRLLDKEKLGGKGHIE